MSVCPPDFGIQPDESLSRASAVREREMSLRLSIGASRSRLIQQMLIESLLLAAVASVLGLLFARVAGPSIIEMLAPSTNPVYLELRTDWRLLAFLCLAGALTTILFGLAPALRASRAAPIGVLRGGEARTTSRTGLSRPLVAVQVSFSLAILFVAGLLFVSFGRLADADVGFAKDRPAGRVDSRDRLDPEMARTAASRARACSQHTAFPTPACGAAAVSAKGVDVARPVTGHSPTASLLLVSRCLQVFSIRWAYACWTGVTSQRATQNRSSPAAVLSQRSLRTALFRRQPRPLVASTIAPASRRPSVRR